MVENKYPWIRKYMEERGGICKFVLEDNCIFPNGDIILCGWFDINRLTIIGNLNKRSLEDIYHTNGGLYRIINEQKNFLYRGICMDCTIWKNKDFDSTVKREDIKEIND